MRIHRTLAWMSRFMRFTCIGHGSNRKVTVNLDLVSMKIKHFKCLMRVVISSILKVINHWPSKDPCTFGTPQVTDHDPDTITITLHTLPSVCCDFTQSTRPTVKPLSSLRSRSNLGDRHSPKFREFKKVIIFFFYHTPNVLGLYNTCGANGRRGRGKKRGM